MWRVLALLFLAYGALADVGAWLAARVIHIPERQILVRYISSTVLDSMCEQIYNETKDEILWDHRALGRSGQIQTEEDARIDGIKKFFRRKIKRMHSAYDIAELMADLIHGGDPKRPPINQVSSARRCVATDWSCAEEHVRDLSEIIQDRSTGEIARIFKDLIQSSSSTKINRALGILIRMEAYRQIDSLFKVLARVLFYKRFDKNNRKELVAVKRLLDTTASRVCEVQSLIAGHGKMESPNWGGAIARLLT